MRQEMEQAFEDHTGRYVEQWRKLVSFPTISAEPAHDDDCRACADWLVEHLQGMGFDGSILPTSGKPLVYAVRKANADRPVVLFYGHYDVQPVDPLDEWDTPPFELTEKSGRLYGRGAQDNKGQLFYALKAMETLIAHERLDVTVKILLEGEEECGSSGLSSALPELREQLSADILMVCDTDTNREGGPTIIMGLRGVAALTVSLSGPDYDLHSGMHGGLAPNPAAAMARLVASLHREDGAIAVPGFYDGVRSPTEEERDLANAETFDASRYKAETGVAPVGGERNFTPAERVGFRPSLDINGISSGYSGVGMKTIIPARATAKVTARLVPDQDPEECLDAIERHCRDHAPDGLTVSFSDRTGGGRGFRLDTHSSIAARAKCVLDTLTDRETTFHWEGAAIPIVASLAEASGADPLLVGFGSERDRIHAPNESFSIDQLRHGFLYVGLMLASL